jgi:ADP-ribose pyrophosphatase
MLKRTDTVSVICAVDDQLLVVDDEQPHLGSRRSFPGGRIDPTDNTIEAAARREILEETGYSFKNWRLIKVSQPYRKIEWFVHLFIAWDVEAQQEPMPDAGEKITVAQLDFEELKQQVLADTGYLGESRDIFRNLHDVRELLQLPAFQGQEVDR